MSSSITPSQKTNSPCEMIREKSAEFLSWGKNTIEKYKEPAKALIAKIEKVAAPTLYILTGTFFFLASTNFFIFGMAAAVLSPKFMNDCIKRIQSVFTKIALFTWVPLTLGAVFAGPLLLGISSFFIGGHVCLQFLPKHEAENPKPQSDN